MTMRKEHEHLHQMAVIQWRDAQKGKIKELRWLHAIPNGGQRHPAVANKLRAEGVTSGVFDLFLPVARQGYHGLYIEMKAGKGYLSDNQKSFEAFITEQGYQAVTCWSADSAIEAIKEYLEDA